MTSHSAEQQAIIQKTADYVREKLTNAASCHDWWHIQRVWHNARLIGQNEHADMFVAELAAILHDLADSKFHNGDETLGPRLAAEFLYSLAVPETTVEHVRRIIANISFRSSLSAITFHSKELEIVQDADRLDAIGAIGIARAFAFGGLKQRPLYDPETPPKLHNSTEEYKNAKSATINHFYEKLLLLKDKMNTRTGKRIAQYRHLMMEDFLDQFHAEWDGLC